MKRLKQYLLDEDVLNEKTGAKLLRIIAGNVPGIESYGLLTGENPYGEESGPKENKASNDALESDLKRMGLGYYKVKGKFFGNNEHSFLIPNISEDNAKKLGDKYGQESVIHGEKSIGNSGNPIMLHKYISDGKVVKTRKSFKHLAQDLDDMYTQAKNKKFEVPFFDPEERGTELVGGKRVKQEPSTDVDITPTTNPEKEKMKSNFTAGKMKLLNLNGREVWVNKENQKYYLNQGYKQVKANK